MPAIMATEAKRSFGSVLAGVANGESYTVFRRSKPVARIVPVGSTSGESQFASLAGYADPSARRLEERAFAHAMEAKHGGH